VALVLLRGGACRHVLLGSPDAAVPAQRPCSPVLDVFDVHPVFLYFQSEPVQHLVISVQLELEHAAGKEGRNVVNMARAAYAFDEPFVLAVGQSLVPVGLEVASHRSKAEHDHGLGDEGAVFGQVAADF
jgi:hypothetical protein